MSSSHSSEHSVTKWFGGLHQGDQQAAQVIFERYLEKLVHLADKKLKASKRTAMDEEDVVQVVFENFFRQVQNGRFPKLEDRHDLWQILAMLVDHKAIDQIRRQNTQKAGGGQEAGESVFKRFVEDSIQQGIDQVPDDMINANEAVEMSESIRNLLDQLDEPHRSVAKHKLANYTNKEIANKMGCGLRTVERHLESIRKHWAHLTG